MYIYRSNIVTVKRNNRNIKQRTLFLKIKSGIMTLTYDERK